MGGGAETFASTSRKDTASAGASGFHRAKVILSFAATWFIWGSTYLAIHYAVQTIPPLYAAGLRHLSAGLILFAWCAYKRLRSTWTQIRASFVIGAFFSSVATVLCIGRRPVFLLGLLPC